jgi:hypothetical protein
MGKSRLDPERHGESIKYCFGLKVKFVYFNY